MLRREQISSCENRDEDLIDRLSLTMSMAASSKASPSASTTAVHTALEEYALHADTASGELPRWSLESNHAWIFIRLRTGGDYF
jgi:hypothetical protein